MVSKDGIWYSNNKAMRMDEMSTAHLKKAAEYCARKQDLLHKELEKLIKTSNKFIELENQLTNELERRGIKEYITETGKRKFETT